MVRVRRATRENILFFAGLVGLTYETVWEHIDRPWLLGLFAGMLGLNVFTADALRGGRRREDPQ